MWEFANEKNQNTEEDLHLISIESYTCLCADDRIYRMFCPWDIQERLFLCWWSICIDIAFLVISVFRREL